MGAKRLIILAIAAVAAICFALIMRGVMGSRAPTAAADPTPRTVIQVLVAKRDLPTGTRLAAGDIGWQPWPASGVNGAFITDGHGDQPIPTTPVAQATATADHAANLAAASVTGSPMDALYGAMVRDPIMANEPITNNKLLRSGDGGYMAVVLKPGMRAISVPVTVATAAGGFILPGDRVEVMQARPSGAPSDGGRPTFVVVHLLRNVRVLAIDQATQPVKGSETLVGGVATLEVADEDADIVALAKAQGEITLALRPFAEGAEAERPSDMGETADSGSVRVVRAGQANDVMVAR